MRFLNLFIILLCLCSCNKSKVESHNKVETQKIIYLQPYDSFTFKEAESLSNKIKSNLLSLYNENWGIKILPNKSLPNNSYYKPRNRYLANVILRDLQNPRSNTYIIGLTHKDISFKIHGYDNYGIMGLTPLGESKSIVSDYRAKNNNFIAVIVHEFGHGYYGLKHCENVNCIMCDYQKHKNKPFKFNLCESHKNSKKLNEQKF